MPIEKFKTLVRRYLEKVLPNFQYTIFGVAGRKVGDSGAVAREIPRIGDASLAEDETLFDRLFLWKQPSLVPATVDCLARVNNPYLSQDSKRL